MDYTHPRMDVMMVAYEPIWMFQPRHDDGRWMDEGKGDDDASSSFNPSTTHGPQVKMTNLNPVNALAHYVLRSQSPLHVDFKDLDLRHIPIDQFPKIQTIIQNTPARHVQELEDQQAFQLRGLQAHSIGNTTLKIKGRFYKGNGIWIFRGKVESGMPDKYNFDPNEKKRGKIADNLTKMGALIPGEEYKIYFHGSQHIERTGKLSK